MTGSEYTERLVVDWGPGTRSWAQPASRQPAIRGHPACASTARVRIQGTTCGMRERGLRPQARICTAVAEYGNVVRVQVLATRVQHLSQPLCPIMVSIWPITVAERSFLP
jgi:hypothetical protein